MPSPTHPADLTPDERRAELARLFASALFLRHARGLLPPPLSPSAPLLASTPPNPRDSSPYGLAIRSDSSVHGTPRVHRGETPETGGVR